MLQLCITLGVLNPIERLNFSIQIKETIHTLFGLFIATGGGQPVFFCNFGSYARKVDVFLNEANLTSTTLNVKVFLRHF